MKRQYWDELFLDDQFEFEQEQRERERELNASAEWNGLEGGERPVSMAQWRAAIDSSVVYDHGQRVELREVKLFDNHISLKLPYSLHEVPKGLAAPTGEREHEQLMYLDRDGLTAFGATWMAHALPVEAVVPFKQRMIGQWRGDKPGVQIVHEETMESNGRLLSWFECYMPNEPLQLYQLVFVTTLQGRALLGSFQFKLEDAQLWQPTAVAIMQTMELHE
ncbi:hypothetical protein [Paenibacillus sp. MMS18-CY102]|uniref:hypothetical protein n=1 Tax=Paenibacillus sp. MMS18-CY102 TaxID=2682849 RepID=UPI0013658723|nr:hypothetical protein [Paenibacillus sp. MMS18-CY102]MWC30009.1 hypothetical protein [Paenibacillus sp. MMS18-CY102]